MTREYNLADLCIGCGCPWDTCLCDYPDDFNDYADDATCDDCGGEGWIDGADLAPYYDVGWIDENKAYPCKKCGGKGFIDYPRGA